MLTIKRHPHTSELSDELHHIIESLASEFDAIREISGLPPLETLEVVIADDLQATVRELAHDVVGSEMLNDFGTDRLGGIVAGKTMAFDTEKREQIVVLAADALDTSSVSGTGWTILLVAHELAHTLYGQTRRAAGIEMDPADQPWEIARWLCRFAFEEYLADSLAEAVLGTMGTATTDTGENVPPRSAYFWPRADEFVQLALGGLDDLIETISSYRHGRIGLDDMWPQVSAITNEIMITLSHAQAETDNPNGRIADPVTDAERFGPLHDCWRRLHALYSDPNSLMSVEEFGATEPEVLDRGRDALLTFWAEIGLTFEPLEEGFYIAVAAPHESWCGTT